MNNLLTIMKNYVFTKLSYIVFAIICNSPERIRNVFKIKRYKYSCGRPKRELEQFFDNHNIKYHCAGTHLDFYDIVVGDSSYLTILYDLIEQDANYTILVSKFELFGYN